MKPWPLIELLIFDGGISDVDCSRPGRPRPKLRRSALRHQRLSGCGGRTNYGFQLW